MKNRIFTLDRNRRLKDIITFIQSKKCQRLLIHLHGADNKKFKKRIKKLRQAFPNAKLFATVKTNEKAKTTVAFICLDQIKDIEAVYQRVVLPLPHQTVMIGRIDTHNTYLRRIQKGIAYHKGLRRQVTAVVVGNGYGVISCLVNPYRRGCIPRAPVVIYITHV